MYSPDSPSNMWTEMVLAIPDEPNQIVWERDSERPTYLDWRPEDTVVVTWFLGPEANWTTDHRWARTAATARRECQAEFGRIVEWQTSKVKASFRVMRRKT